MTALLLRLLDVLTIAAAILLAKQAWSTWLPVTLAWCRRKRGRNRPQRMVNRSGETFDPDKPHV